MSVASRRLRSTPPISTITPCSCAERPLTGGAPATSPVHIRSICTVAWFVNRCAREVDRIDAVPTVVGDLLRELRAGGAVVLVAAEQGGRIAPVGLQQPRDFRVIEDIRGASVEQAVAGAAVGRDRFGLTTDQLAKGRIGVAPSLKRAKLRSRYRAYYQRAVAGW